MSESKWWAPRRTLRVVQMAEWRPVADEERAADSRWSAAGIGRCLGKGGTLRVEAAADLVVEIRDLGGDYRPAVA